MMNQFLSGLTLLADNRIADMGQRFRIGSSHVETGDFLALATILISAVLAIWLLSRLAARRERFNSPRALFAHLCRAHRLNWSSRRLLQRLARLQDLQHPARLFLEPERFDAANLPRDLRGEARRLENLRDQLFSFRLKD